VTKVTARRTETLNQHCQKGNPPTSPADQAVDGVRGAGALSRRQSLTGQPPMDGANIEGDYSIRLLDVDTPLTALHVWHTHFDTRLAQQDINVVYPVDRLQELAEERVIGRVATPAVGFMGYFTNVFCIRDEVAPVDAA